MQLIDLITKLKEIDPEKTVKYGFGSPDSYRGYYEDLAFEPLDNAKIGDMLNHAMSALDATFTGYKGGDFTMHEFTDCWISEYGRCSGNKISDQLINYWKDE